MHSGPAPRTDAASPPPNAGMRVGPGGSARVFPSGASSGPADVAALAVHLMINTALTGATYDVDGGQQLID